MKEQVEDVPKSLKQTDLKMITEPTQDSGKDGQGEAKAKENATREKTE